MTFCEYTQTHWFGKKCNLGKTLLKVRILDQNSGVSIYICWVYNVQLYIQCAVHKFIAARIKFRCGGQVQCSVQVQYSATASASTLAGAPALDLAITRGGGHHCYFHGSSSLSSSSFLFSAFWPAFYVFHANGYFDNHYGQKCFCAIFLLDIYRTQWSCKQSWSWSNAN